MKIGFGSKDIALLNWAKLKNLRTLEAEDAVTALSPFRQNYVLPQLMAFLGGSKIKLSRNSTGKISITETLKSMSKEFDEGNVTFDKGQIVTKDDFVGILFFLTHPVRKDILPDGVKQVSPEWIRYSSAVPLVLSAFKERRNVKYSDWDLDDLYLGRFVDYKWVEVLKMSGTEFGWDTETLKAFQDQARLVKSGKTAGSVRHLNSTCTISKTGDSDFDDLPGLAKVILCQTWLWQPNLRTSLGIYNITNIDSLPEDLIDTTMLSQKKVIASAKSDIDDMWG